MANLDNNTDPNREYKLRPKRLRERYEDTLIERVLEEKAKEKAKEEDAAKLKRRKIDFKTRAPKNNVRTYFIWGGYYSVPEIAKKLNLSKSFCYRKIREGYINHLENYKRESYQINTVDVLRKDGYWDKKEEQEEVKNFLNNLLDEYHEEKKYSWEEDDYGEEWNSEYE